jgi:hypothetical protein
MGSRFYSSMVEGDEESRKADFFTEIALNALDAFWKHAKINDVIDSIDAQEESWPSERLTELSNRLSDMAHEARLREQNDSFRSEYSDDRLLTTDYQDKDALYPGSHLPTHGGM